MNKQYKYLDRLNYVIGYLTPKDGTPPHKQTTLDYYGLVAEIFFARVLPAEGRVKYAIRNEVKSWLYAIDAYPMASAQLEERIANGVAGFKLLYPDIMPKPEDIGAEAVPEEVLDRAEVYRARTPTLDKVTARGWARVIKIRRV